MDRYQLGECVVTINRPEQQVDTRFADGTHVTAKPNYEPEHEATAVALGYTGYDIVWQMTADHDIMHTWLATQAGQPHSRTLWYVAHPNNPGDLTINEIHDEEHAVLDATYHLDKTASRPWTPARVNT